MQAEPDKPLTILAADIGGTHSRFAVATVDQRYRAELGPVFNMDTQQQGVSSFPEFWECFSRCAPSELVGPESFDAIALALAGAVSDCSAVLPNINWDISHADSQLFPNLCLLNDFVAQGYALARVDALQDLEIVRQGKKWAAGQIALVGAGTGLGHCVLLPQASKNPSALPYRVSGSEAGHASFSFQGAREKDLEQSWLELCNKAWLSNDDVVSGAGAVHLHACLTGDTVSAGEALADGNSETEALFSRFYARACRNFCLNVFPVSALVLSGGVAVKNPHLVKSKAFMQSFNDGYHYSDLLSSIPVLLNNDPLVGIRGAAIYAASRLRQP